MIDSVLTPGQQNYKSLADRFSVQGPDYAAIVEKFEKSWVISHSSLACVA